MSVANFCVRALSLTLFVVLAAGGPERVLLPNAIVYERTETHPCHNATGACLSSGKFRCLTTVADRKSFPDGATHDGEPSHEQPPWPSHPEDATDHDEAPEHVRWDQRCDGAMDCADGSDEMHCELLPWAPDHPGYYVPTAAAGADVSARQGDHQSANEARADRGRIMHPLFSDSTCIGCTCLVNNEFFMTDKHPWFTMALYAKPSGVFGLVSPPGLGCSTATKRLKLNVYKKYRLCRMAVCCIEQTGCYDCGTKFPPKCYDF